MNEVFIIGKVISKADYRFIVNKKKQFAKVEFKIQVDKQIIRVIGYNDIADFCLKYLKEKNSVFINGVINTQIVITINTIEIL